MPSPLLLAEQRATLDSLNILAIRDLVELWRGLEFGDARAVTGQLLRDVPELVTAYGEMAADLAGDLYDEIRAEAGAPGRFAAARARPAPVTQSEALVRWGVDPLWSAQPSPPMALRWISGGVSRLVLKPARDTVVESVKRDPARPRMFRDPNFNACPFCLMLAARGAVYTMKFEAHDNCKCRALPLYRHEELPVLNQSLAREWDEVTAGASSSAEARRLWAEHFAA